MIDFSFIGKEGMIIQFEDIVSMIGFNIARYFKLKGFPALQDKDLKELITSYVDRGYESYDKWISETVGSELKIESYIDSVNAFQPSWLYAYKIFDTAYKNGIKNLVIFSNVEIPFIKTDIIPTFNIPSVKYVYGDIVPFLNEHPNYTYMTSLPSNIEKCLDVKAPFALTICDDYLYTAEVIDKQLVEKLREKDKFVSFTGIFSSGFVDNIK